MATKTSRERQAAWRERVRQDRAYIAALERAVFGLSAIVNDQHPIYRNHAPTIARARAAQQTQTQQED